MGISNCRRCLNNISYDAAISIWNGSTHGFGNAAINWFFWCKCCSGLCILHEGRPNREVWRYELQLRIQETALDIYQSLHVWVYLLARCKSDGGGPFEGFFVAVVLPHLLDDSAVHLESEMIQNNRGKAIVSTVL